MKVTSIGYDYELENRSNPNLAQAIHFAIPRTDVGGKRVVDRDGTTGIECLKMLIDHYTYLDKVVPDYHNEIAIVLLKSALNHQLERKQERKEQGIHQTLTPSINHKEFSYAKQ